MPDLQSLSRLVLKTDEWDQDGASLDELLHQALPMVQQVFPFITALRIFAPASSRINLEIAARTDQDTASDMRLPEDAIQRLRDKPLINLGDSACVMRLREGPAGEQATILQYVFESKTVNIDQDDEAALALTAKSLLKAADSALSESDDVRFSTDEIPVQGREALLLYQIDNALIKVANSMDVVRGLKKAIAADASLITLVVVEWDDTTNLPSAVIREAVIDDRGDQISSVNLIAEADEKTRRELVEEWELQGQQIEFVEDLSALIEERPAVRRSYENGIRSNIVIPVYDDNRLVRQLYIGYREHRAFDESIRRVYNAMQDRFAIVLQNQRLLRESQKSATQLEQQVKLLQTINNLSSSLLQMNDMDTLLKNGASAFQEAFSIRHVSIVFYDEETEQGSIVSEAPAIIGIGTKLDFTSDLQKELLSTLHTLIVRDVATDERVDSGLRTICKEGGIKGFVILPLLNERGEFMGSVGLDIFEDEETLPDETIAAAQTVARQFAVALQNLRLLNDIRQQANQLEGVAGFSQAIQSSLELDSLLEIALLTLPQVFKASHLAVFIYDSAVGSLRKVAWSQSEQNVHIDLKNGPLIQGDNTVPVQVWRQKLTLQINDFQTETQYRWYDDSEVRSLLASPIYARGAVIGAVEMGHSKPNLYSNLDNSIFLQAASQLSIAIENAEAYSQSRRLARSKTLTNEISSRLQQQTDLRNLMEMTVNELGRALGASRARIRLNSSLVVRDEEQQR